MFPEELSDNGHQAPLMRRHDMQCLENPHSHQALPRMQSHAPATKSSLIDHRDQAVFTTWKTCI